MVDWDNMSFGEKIKHARETMGLSQGKLAKLSGLAQSSISYIESGNKKPNIETVMILAKALDLAPSYLLDNAQVDEALPPNLAELVKAASRLPNDRIELLIKLARGMKDSEIRLL